MNYKSYLSAVVLLASTYGSNGYGSALYSADSGTTQVGPITLPFTLPVTGSTVLSIGGAALVAGAAGLFVYARQRRRRRLDEAAS